MDKIINITVKNKIAMRTNDTIYVCGNSDFVLAFDFDEEWNEFFTKTARFIYGGQYQDIIFQGNQCPVPVISNAYNINVGVFAGDLRTTTPAHISAKKSILCGNGSPAAPPEDVYAQIMDLLNKLNGDIGAAVEEYLRENPIEGTTFTTDKTLTLDPETSVLSVNVAQNAEEDNTLPITSAAVYATVGNIEVLLGTI